MVDPWTVLGAGGILATLAVLLFTDWPKAYTLGISAIVLFALQFAECAIGPTGAYCLGLDGLALSTDRLLAGNVHTPVTYAFLHAGLFHLFGNLFVLLTAGPALEESVGPRWFLGIYALGAIGAALVGVALSLWTDIVPEAQRMVGSSGAIFAVLTAYAVRHPRERLPTILIFLVVWLPAMTVLLIFLALNLAYVFMETNIAWYGHFAGFLVGLALAGRAPMARQTVDRRALSIEALEPLAETKRAKEALAYLADLEAGERDVAAAWLDVLADEASCPVCGRPLHRRGMGLQCVEGHVVAVGAREGEAID